MVAIERHVHAPFVHLLVPDNVRRPLVALHIVALVLPAMTVEVAELNEVSVAVLHLLDGVGVVGVDISYF